MLRSVSGASGNEWRHQQCCKYRRLPSLRNGHTVRVFKGRGTVNHGTVRRQEAEKWSVFVVNEYGSPETFERWDYELFSLGIFSNDILNCKFTPRFTDSVGKIYFYFLLNDSECDLYREWSKRSMDLGALLDNSTACNTCFHRYYLIKFETTPKSPWKVQG